MPLESYYLIRYLLFGHSIVSLIPGQMSKQTFLYSTRILFVKLISRIRSGDSTMYIAIYIWVK